MDLSDAVLKLSEKYNFDKKEAIDFLETFYSSEKKIKLTAQKKRKSQRRKPTITISTVVSDSDSDIEEIM
tara:strand:+ start:163 stop:372 length:210 start_codon:yes stop_codon:yes gene_type:complete